MTTYLTIFADNSGPLRLLLGLLYQSLTIYIYDVYSTVTRLRYW